MKYSMTVGTEDIKKGAIVYMAADGKAYGVATLEDLAKLGRIAVGVAQRKLPAGSMCIAGSSNEREVDVRIKSAA